MAHMAVLLWASASAAQTTTIAIMRVNVVDVADGRILPNSTVLIRDQTIVSVTPSGARTAGARIVDGEGKYLIPGLWDMHAHVEASGESSLQLHVANGVTGIRDMGSDLDLILKMREATSSRRVLGPRIFAAGPILDDAPGDWPFRMRVRTAEEGKAAVQLLKKRGMDLVKVHNFTPREVFFAIAEEARQQDLRVAGHVPLKVTVQEAVEAGLTNIEHLSEDGRVWKACSAGAQYRPEMCRPFFEMLAKRQIWQTPTLLALAELATIGTPQSGIRSEQLAFANKNLREMWTNIQTLFVTKPEIARILKGQAETARAVVNDMAKAGIEILAGCDALIAGFCVHDELELMVRAGMMPLAALQTATINPARYLGLQGSTGAVASGKRADLVLLDANPLADIANIRRIHGVVAGGQLLDRASLDKMLIEVKVA